MRASEFVREAFDAAPPVVGVEACVETGDLQREPELQRVQQHDAERRQPRSARQREPRQVAGGHFDRVEPDHVVEQPAARADPRAHESGQHVDDLPAAVPGCGRLACEGTELAVAVGAEAGRSVPAVARRSRAGGRPPRREAGAGAVVRALASACRPRPGQRGDGGGGASAPAARTMTVTPSPPAFANRSSSGNVSPATSGFARPISMMCVPFGASTTRLPAGTVDAFHGAHLRDATRFLDGVQVHHGSPRRSWRRPGCRLLRRRRSRDRPRPRPRRERWRAPRPAKPSARPPLRRPTVIASKAPARRAD